MRRVYRSVKVTKHGTIPYVRYGFQLLYYYAEVTLSLIKTHHFSDIPLQSPMQVPGW